MCLWGDWKSHVFKVMIKREYTTAPEVDVVPWTIHCLQMVEVNPQLGLYCNKNIFNGSIYRPVGGTKYIPVSRDQNPIHHQRISVCAEIVHCNHKQPAWMILIQIINNMISKTVESFNCHASLHPLFMPMHPANIITANCKK